MKESKMNKFLGGKVGKDKLTQDFQSKQSQIKMNLFQTLNFQGANMKKSINLSDKTPRKQAMKDLSN